MTRELERNGRIQEMLMKSSQHDLVIDFIERSEVIGNIQAEWTAVPFMGIRKSRYGHPWPVLLNANATSWEIRGQRARLAEGEMRPE